ncbi:FAD/NAD(P)-binding protein [Micrococcus sp.]|uniref:FAD/NAD(P)-binding protein n=1 Tax=Micrococcus sp. TaxID=1271 RepID=UPI002A915EE1|nr:FAD/NAD(P)-binding protein [Micrococcus sp.]MDY6055180.1 FAD/NAD(P)-binding protein [Micrococcus sp.]
MRDSTEIRELVVVGAGPRGVMVLERLLAQLEGIRPGDVPSRWRVHVVDPFRPGPGRVWRTDQSEHFLMNTPVFFPTASAADNPGLRPSSVAVSFDQWRRVHPEESLHVLRHQYPARAVYGRYLRSLYGDVVGALRLRPEIEEVLEHRAEVTALHPRADGGARLELRPAPLPPEAATTVPAPPAELEADTVVLCLGHQDAELTAAQRRLAQAARTWPDLHYQGPQIPADVDWSVVGDGADVLVRGMGLNAFDLLAQLTQGRGGVYQRTGEGAGRALRYEPSGREPRMHWMSRRGVPYLPKAEVDAFVPRGVSLAYLSEAAVAALVREHGVLDMAEHIWPLLHRDVVRHYYATMVRVQPEILGGPVAARRFLGELVGLLEEAGRGAPVTARHAEELLYRYAPERRFLDIRAYAAPFRDQVFASDEEYQEAVAELMGQACVEAARGEDSPFMMAVGALHAGRLRIKAWVAEGLISEASRIADIQGWFEPLVEGLASGPPLWRVEQMLALHRAGLLRWVGPEPAVDVDDVAGRFRAQSAQVGDANTLGPAVVEGTWLVEAMMPANRVEAAVSPLIRQMLADGVAATGSWEDEEGSRRSTPGFDVTARPYRLRAADGTVHERILVLGLQLAGVQWGTAIAAEAGAEASGRAMFLADADAAARSVLAG